MGLLVGLPLGIFRLLFALVVLVLRLALPVLMIAIIVYLFRRGKQGGGHRESPPRQEAPRDPHFDGPVYTVDYQEVDEEQEE